MKKPIFSGMVLAILFMVIAFAPASAADNRHYCIAADEILWDYAPSFPTNLMTGQPFTPEQRVFVEGDGKFFIGHIYRKAVYRQYLYDSGTGTCNWGTRIDGPTGVGETPTRTPGSNQEHLGILGPILRAAVNDNIIAHFRNNTPGQTLSMHPHGVFYTKSSEGTPMDDGTTGADKADDAVPPGGTHDYVWEVRDRAGPGLGDAVSSLVWVYHSHTDEVADTNAGLIGAIVITRAGQANPDGTPVGVAREFVSLFTVFDENASLYIDQNIAQFAPKALAKSADAFEESNLMHGINGLVFGNNMGYTMNPGENVRWYLIGMGTEVDIHTPHWHGVTVLDAGSHRLDVAELMPAVGKTFDLVPDNPGNWMFHCHVNDHILAGMMTMFTINP